MVSPTRVPGALVSIVEDDASVRRALLRLVESAGYTVEVFASGGQVLESDLLAKIECFVLDVHLGDMTAFELQKRLGARGIDIPAIFITAHDDEPTRQAARTGVAYFPKPVDSQILLDAIQRALARPPQAG